MQSEMNFKASMAKLESRGRGMIAGSAVRLAANGESCQTQGAPARLKKQDKRSGSKSQPIGLVEFFRRSPLVGVDLDLERVRDTD